MSLQPEVEVAPENRLPLWLCGLAAGLGALLVLLLVFVLPGSGGEGRDVALALAGAICGSAVVSLALRLWRTAPAAAAGPLAIARDTLPAIVDHAVDGTVVIDEEGRIVGFSKPAERIFGYTAAEVTGRNVSQLMAEPDRSAHDGYLGTYRLTGVANIIGVGREVQGRRKDGSVFQMDLAVSEMPGPDGRRFIGTVRDIGRRKAGEEQMRQAAKMDAIGLLTGGIAHDFNNLLAVMLGNLQLAAETPAAQAEPLLANVRRAAERAAEMTRRLLAFSRRQALLARPVDLNRLLAGMADLLRDAAGGRIALDLRLTAEPLSAEVDPESLAEAMLNLVANAREAMPDGGVLTIATGNAVVEEAPGDTGVEAVAPGTYRTVTVTDTGIGMTRDVRARAFEPFFTTKEMGAGSGLGLSMVYGFVRQSGGDVAIDSAPGRGTAVTLSLPAAAVAPAAAEPPAAAKGTVAMPAAADAKGRGQSILLVEDDEDVRPLVALMLQRLGYKPVVAADSGEALAALDSQPEIAAMLTDVVMPKGMDGLALAAAARSRRPDMPVIFITGYSHQTQALVEAVNDGASLLCKPFTPDDLGQVLTQAMAGRDEAEPPAIRPISDIPSVEIAGK